ncbi:hypothetical protein ETAA8_36390 [Anatilimnocola aggregata]|uniref:Uncharacterized protein n=1 Tax=Anatilimnocola aggregata TaxID=2528021 RepID=A0A517YE93_9BACT|nr:hypothetical protein ETAA8_36390 [Anatilimnocola aggregata]
MTGESEVVERSELIDEKTLSSRCELWKFLFGRSAEDWGDCVRQVPRKGKVKDSD